MKDFREAMIKYLEAKMDSQQQVCCKFVLFSVFAGKTECATQPCDLYSLSLSLAITN